MTEASDREREVINKEMKEKQVASSMRDYKSEDKNEMAKIKIEYTEVTPMEERDKHE